VFKRLAALVAVPLLALTACGSGDDQPTADGSDRPDYAENPGQTGAEQFAGFWVDTLNQATESGKTEELRSLAAPSCDTCTDFADQLDTIYDDGGRVESKGWQIDAVVPEKGADEDAVGLLVTVAVSPQKVYASEDAKPQKFPGGDQRFRFQLERQDGDWMVRDLAPR
jgi:hypothetical protein